MKLYCPKCASEISAQDMNLERMIAKCGNCDSVFSFASELPPTPSKHRVIEAPKPERVVVSENAGNLLLRWSWFHWHILLLTVFCLFWNSIVFSFVGSGIFTVFQGDFSGLYFMLLPHFWVGVGLAYYVVCGYVNKTSVFMEYDSLRVRHGPLPFWGNRTLSASDIVQVYTKQASHRRRNSVELFEVHAVMAKGKHQKLLSGLMSSEHALFVEQEIERYFDIDNLPVRGEYGQR